MYYNMTGVISGNLINTMIAVDKLSNNILINGFLMGVFVVLFVTMIKNSPVIESALSSSLITAVITIIFYAAGLTSLLFAVGFGLLASISAIVLYIENRT